MKKKFTILFLILGLLAANIPIAAVQAAEPTVPQDAQVDLLLPTEYEQFLNLNAPTDFAFSDKYTAIADKPSQSENQAVIYIYDRAAGAYKTYTTDTADTISSLNFYSCESGDYLFYILPANRLFRIDLNKDDLPSEEITTITPSVMLIHKNNEIYYSTQTGSSSMLFYATLNGLNIENNRQIGTQSLQTAKPAFSDYEDFVYVSEGREIYSCTQTGYTFLYRTHDAADSFAVLGKGVNELLYTNAGHLLYYGDEKESRGQACRAVRNFRDSVYILTVADLAEDTKGCMVQYDVAQQKFTDYRVCKYSDITNRLGENDKGQISVWGERIAVTDRNNERVLIGDKADTSSFTEISTPGFQPYILCAGEDTFAVSDGLSLRLYKYMGELITTVGADVLDATVHDLTYTYGTFYCTTNKSANAHTLTQDGTFTSGHNALNITSLSADIFGNIYCLQGKSVYRYTQDSFAANTSGELTATFPESPQKLASDYAGNLYALTESKVYRFDADSKQTDIFDFSASLNSVVYNNITSAAKSFAVGFEDNRAYILSDGFIVSTQDFNIESLNNLSATQVNEAVFQQKPNADFAQNRLVHALPNCVGITLNAQKFNEQPSVLPTESYRQFDSERIGTVLADVDCGVIALFYEQTESGIETKQTYEICLLLHGSDYRLSASENFTPDDRAATVSNNVQLFKYPAMHTGSSGNLLPLGILKNLEKGTAVQILGILESPAPNAIDSPAYRFVRVQDGDETLYGFIPFVYLVESGEQSADPRPFTYRNLAKGSEITLSDGENAIVLNDRQQLKVYGEADENGQIFVSYTDENEHTYSGIIDESLLQHKDNSSIAILIIVPAVAAVTLLSTGYLILRKKPTLR